MTRPLPFSLILAAAVAVAGTPAVAQAPQAQAPINSTAGGAAGGRALAPGVQIQLDTPAGAAAPGTVDETALRYYARTGDVARLEAEIARLRAINPQWQPPSDLFSPQAPSQGPSFDETPIWRLMSSGKTAEARAAIAEERRRTPAWQPSDKLLHELDLAEATGRMAAAMGAKRWQEVLDTAAATPEVASCTRLDNLWRVAEAHGQLKQTDQAFDVYRRIVTSCPKAAERRDTIYKAGPFLPPERLRELADLAATSNPAEGEDYAVVRRALQDLDVGRTLSRLGGGRGEQPTADELASAQAAVLERRDAGGALALGWHHQSRKRHEEARQWFSRSNEWQPGDQAVEGLVLALTGLGRRQEALEAGKGWQGRSARVDRALRAARPPAAQPGRGTAGQGAGGWGELERALAQRDYGRCLQIIERMSRGGMDASLAQQRGWCLMELKRPTEAEEAFAQAKALASKAPAADRVRLADSAAYGETLARLQTDDAEGVLQELPNMRLTPERERSIRANTLATQALQAYEEKRYRDTLRLLDARLAFEPEPRGLTIMRGWTHYNTQRIDEALRIFEALDRRFSTEETREAVGVVKRAMYRGG